MWDSYLAATGWTLTLFPFIAVHNSMQRLFISVPLFPAAINFKSRLFSGSLWTVYTALSPVTFNSWEQTSLALEQHRKQKDLSPCPACLLFHLLWLFQMNEISQSTLWTQKPKLNKKVWYVNVKQYIISFSNMNFNIQCWIEILWKNEISAGESELYRIVFQAHKENSLRQASKMALK